MKNYKLDEMIRGWFVGNFDPSVFKTNDVEVGVKEYKKGDTEEKHHHKIATEITVIISGKVRMNDKIYSKGDIVMIYPGEATDFEALEDTTNVVVKLPGVNNDKYLGECQLVIPMTGLGSRFAKAGFDKPKPFIDVLDKPMIVRVLENLKYKDARYILIARKEHLTKEKKLVDEIKNNFNVEFIPIDKLTEGTACTVLYARKYINNDMPLMIANSDQIVDINIADFINDSFKRGLDGSILTFIDKEKNPKWSFAKLNNDLVVEVKEKEAITEFATVGIYFFNKGKIFVESAIDMIIENDRVNNEFYTCPVYNYAIKSGAKIGIYNIDFSKMHGIGTPEDLEIFKAINKL